jgi:hypothetical protein
MAGTGFTDEQVTSACKLHIDNLRRLITWGAVEPVQAGGGRGRVRKWTMRQGLRISVTAQFVEAGFSLQMAHTLTYCLPLDDLLYLYDPEVIRAHFNKKNDIGSRRLRAMISSRGKNYWPTRDYLGSEMIIIDRRYVYADVLGDSGMLFAVIDLKQQRVYPLLSPSRYYEGMGVAQSLGLKNELDIRDIARSSLLIDDEFLSEELSHNRFRILIPEDLDWHIGSLDRMVCRNLCLINLAVGLTEFVRKLLGFQVNYYPFEERLYDTIGN